MEADTILTVGGALVVAILSATGAVWLDRAYQERDRRRDIYLEWLELYDTQRAWIRETTIYPDRASEMELERERKLRAVQGKVALLASDEVRRTIVAYREAWSKAVDELRDPREKLSKTSTPGGTATKAQSPDVLLRAAFDDLEEKSAAERKAMINAMRADLRTKLFSRRRS